MNAQRIAPRRRTGTVEDVEQEIAGLSNLDASALRGRWTDLYGAPPSLQLGRTFIILAVAYRLQERACGGLTPATRRLLEQIAEGRSATMQSRKASPGTVLIRQWRGVAHRVAVLDHEVHYNGRRYPSLSAVARVITGSRWSGPRFFGLTQGERQAADD